MCYKIFRIGRSRVTYDFLCNRWPRVVELERYFPVINSSIIYLRKKKWPILNIWAVYNEINVTDPTVVSLLMK